LQTIDQRFPTLDDNAALRVILRKYKAVLREKGFLLLQRDTARRNATSQATAPVLKRKVRFGEAIDIRSLEGDKQYSLSLDLRYSWLGRIRQFLYRAPLTSIEVELADGSKRHYRIIPGMARFKFLFTPLMWDRQEVVVWDDSTDQQKVVSFQILLNETKQLRYFDPQIAVSLQEEPL
jgi:hypothetical protein